MLAEVYGKISSSGSNLSAMSEDKLTGDVFGAIRYIPFNKGLKRILSAVRIYQEDEHQQFLRELDSYKLNYISESIQFWPYHKEAEIDIFVTLPDSIIGIEVKYESGLSSWDQLEREARVLLEQSPLRKPYLFLLGLDPKVSQIAEEAYSRGTLNNVIFGYLSWQDVYEALLEQLAKASDEPEKTVLEDIVLLLRKKGFARFKGFDNGINNITISDSMFFSFDVKTLVSFETNSRVKVGLYYEFK